MPNGYIDAMRIFNKSLKPVFASLHKFGYESSVYVDDSLLLATNVLVLATISLLQALGFFIHPSLYLYPHKK